MLITGTEITTLVGIWLWPLFRVAGMVMAAPVFGAKTVPARVRLVLALGITALVAPLLPPAPLIDLLSPLTYLLILHQIIIGVALGFTVQLVFSAVITGGQIIAMQMGLGFSVMVDPQNGQQAPVLSQFYVLMIILVYLGLNGHLVIIDVLVTSFQTIPVSAEGMAIDSFRQIAYWGGHLFSGGLAMALPAVASLLLVNIAFGIMTRAAPQLNLFAIGFPVTMVLGFVLIYFTLPSAIPHSVTLFNDVFHFVREILVPKL